MRFLLALVGFGLATGVPNAWAWGDIGHKTVCEIAFQELTQAASDSVRKLLADDGEYETLADACTWADRAEQKSERRGDHYINVPRYYHEIRTDQCRLGDRCLFSAISLDTGVLTSSSSSMARLEALKYLGHWLGDIHQPLHVSYADDQGGNLIAVAGQLCTGNLHSVWDTCIFERRLGTNPAEVAARLRSMISNAQRAEWTDSTPTDWAEESYQFATNPSAAYCRKVRQSCQYDRSRPRYQDTGEEKVVVIDDAYLDYASGVAGQRLQQAGVRLGALLNHIFDPPEYQ